MKNEKCKYLIVDANNIEVTQRKKISSLNDSQNDCTYCGGITNSRQIFIENKIPEQFHKIAFKLPVFIKRNSAEEVLTGRVFNINKISQRKEYVGSERPRYFDGSVIDSSVHLTTPIQLSTYDDVLIFYEQLAEAGYLDDYIKVVKCIFYVKNELEYNGEPTKIEDKATTLLKKRQSKKTTIC